jgi:hypothetical protein
MISKVDLERRRFLKAVGATALTYPFLRGLPSYAAASGTPTYLVLLFTPCGCVRPLWGATDANMQSVPFPAAGAAPTVTTNFVFRETLAPLAPVQSSVIVLDGLNNKAAQGSHEAGMASLWTGITSTGAPSTGPSVDQVIASKLNAGTPFPSIELMARSSADFTDREVKTRMIYNASGAFMDPHDDPAEARSTFFPPAVSMMSGPDKKTFIRGKLFPAINSELTALQPRLCTSDRQQLQALQQGWNDLNQQITAAAAKAASCMPPGPLPAGYQAPSADFPTTVQLQMDLLALALACDLTRVASLQLSTATSQVTHSWLTGTMQGDTHHNYSHMGPQSLYQIAGQCTSGFNNMGQCNTPPDIYSMTNLNYYQSLTQQRAIDAWYAKQVAYLAQKIASFGGAGSGTLLDQCVICWGNELDMGAAHNHDDTPFVLIGGANGQLKTGQMVTFASDFTDGDMALRASKDRSHNDLLLTLAKVMGQTPTCIGDAQYCTGPITQILA